MSVIDKNNFCPCGSGKKFKKCCQEKIGIPTERLDIRYLAKEIKDADLMQEKLDFYEKEKELANDNFNGENFVNCNLIANIKKCYVRGIFDFGSVKKVASLTNIETQAIEDDIFKKVMSIAGGQFIAQINEVPEEKYIEICDALETIASWQLHS